MKTTAKLTGAAVVVGSLIGVLVNSITASGTARGGQYHTSGNRRPAKRIVTQYDESTKAPVPASADH